MSSSLSCRLCKQPITFDNKHISQRTGKKIPLDVENNKPHDYPVLRDQQLFERISRPEHQQTQGAIYNVTKVVVKKSILTLTARPAQGNGFH
jgi:hypothetical protein